ncbi:MAG: TonB-dependent receptor, partial [Planctomycetales bacterium]
MRNLAIPMILWSFCARVATTAAQQPVVPQRPATETVTRRQDQAEGQGDAGDQGGIDSAAADDLESLLRLDLAGLARQNVAAPSLQVPVTTVSRTESTVGKSPAAIFVITNDMIQRSAARTIPDVLRMVPGVDVAQINANTPAVSSRGFSGRFANKLLVQIDGRAVYTPLFAGVRWDAQDVLLEDVERIEVIRGPGATVWGENAVNGIINIITKNAKDTQGVFVDAGAGDEWQSFGSARYGGQLGKNAHYRVWGKWFERDDAPTAQGFPSTGNDNWRMSHGGVRADWKPGCRDSFTFIGEYQDGFAGNRSLAFLAPGVPPPFGTPVPLDDSADLAGGFALTRWTHEIDSEREWSAQLYFDRQERHSVFPAVFLGNDRNTIDFDFQYHFPIGCRNQVVCGFGYRYQDDLVRNGRTTLFIPNERALDTFHYFVQDRFTIQEDLLYFTAGSKFSHNDFTGFEMQPSARVLFTPNERTSIWGAVSRAVRTPSRSEDDLIVRIPAFAPSLLLNGNRAFRSEELTSYEIGARAQPVEEFFWDVAAFYNDYTGLFTRVARFQA